jgi:hypothetical protein
LVRKATIAAVAAAVLTPPLALAATLGIVNGELGSGAAGVPSCDTSFTVAHTTSRGNVTTTTVGDIADPDCSGGELYLTLTDATGAGVGSGGPVAVPNDGDAVADSVAVPLSPTPAASGVAGVRITIVGP